MNHLFIILDSCRFDLFKAAYPKSKFFSKLGPVHRAYSNSNLTPGSFVLMFGHAFFPYPQPEGFPWRKTLNFMQTFPQHHKVLVTGMPWLNPKLDSVRGLLQRFDEVDFHKIHQVCRYGVEKFNRLSSREDLFYILWTGETHLRYEVGADKTKWRKEVYSKYSKSELPTEYLNYLKSRQQAMIMYCDAQLSRLKFRSPTQVTVTADHGDSIGENQMTGHGNDCHPVQFMVPFQYKVLGDHK